MTFPKSWAARTVYRIPSDVNTLAGFQRWIYSDEFPEKLKAHFVRGNIYLDMAKESIQTHVLVRKAIFQKLPNLMDDEDLGEFYPDGILLTNPRARVSNNPDRLAALWKTVETRRVRFVSRKGAQAGDSGNTRLDHGNR